MLTDSAYTFDMNSTDGPSFSTYANFESGSNGSVWGAPEYAVASGDDETDGRTEWDTNDNGGIDSGSVDFSFASNASGTTFSLANSITGTISTDGVSSFSSVTIIAGVQNNAAVEFDGLTITFYDANGNATSQYSASNGPRVDMTDPSSNGVGQEVLVVTPPASAGAVAGVTVTGQIKLTAPAGEYPAADDLFGTIGIN